MTTVASAGGLFVFAIASSSVTDSASLHSHWHVGSITLPAEKRVALVAAAPEGNVGGKPQNGGIFVKDHV